MGERERAREKERKREREIVFMCIRVVKAPRMCNNINFHELVD